MIFMLLKNGIQNNFKGGLVKTGNKRSFTLLEMLAVVAIISLIVGILLPVLSKVRLYANRTRMKDIACQIATVWENYLTDFRCFPPLNITSMDITAIQIIGTKTTSYNKVFVYLDIGTNEWAKGGIYDMWGEKFQVALDNGKSWGDPTAYDGKVLAGPHGTVYKVVAVWSKGLRNGKGGQPDDKDDDIKSW